MHVVYVQQRVLWCLCIVAHDKVGKPVSTMAVTARMYPSGLHSPAPMESLLVSALGQAGTHTPVWRGVVAEASALGSAQMGSQVAVSTTICKTSWKRGTKLCRGQKNTADMGTGTAPALVPDSPPLVGNAKSIHSPGPDPTVSVQPGAFVS